jgi:hypothetical protein
VGRVAEVVGDLAVVEAMVVGEAPGLQHVHELVQEVGQAGGGDDEGRAAGVAGAAAADEVVVAACGCTTSPPIVLEHTPAARQQRVRGVRVAGLDVHAVTRRSSPS